MRPPIANKTDAGNGSKAICRLSIVLRSPSPDPKRSQKTIDQLPHPQSFFMRHKTSRLNQKFLLSIYIAGISIFCGHTHAGIEVEKMNSEQASVAAKFSNLETHSIFQRSTDLHNWEDLIVIGPEFNSVSLPDPASKEEGKLFYRLKPIDTNFVGKAHVNLDPSDAHLFTYRRGPEIEFHLFGTRDTNGQPTRITDFTCRIGNTSYAGSSEAVEINPAQNIPLDPAPGPAIQASYVSGYVKVKINPDCPTANSPPSVEWRVTKFFNPDGLPQDPVSGQRQTTLAPIDKQEDGFNVYKYSIPVYSGGYPVPPAPDLNLWIDVYSQWVGDITFGTRTLDLAEEGADILSKGARVVPGKFIQATGTAGKLISIGLATMAAQTAAENYDFGPPSTYGAYDATEIEARVVMDDGTGESNPFTSWIKFEPNFSGIGPDFVVSDPCAPKAFAITKTYSISDGFNDAERVKLLQFDFSDRLAAFSSSQIDKVEWSIEHRITGVEVTLETDHPNGGNGSVELMRWLNGLSSLTPGFVVPQEVPSNIYSGLFPLTVSKSFQFSLSQSPFKLSFEGDSKPITITESNPAHLGSYKNPFTIEVIATQNALVRSHVFGMSPPVIKEQSKAQFTGTIKIKVFTK